MAGSARLSRLVANLRGQSRLRAVYPPRLQGRARGQAREHERLLDALIDRDKRKASELMRLHVAHARGLGVGQPEG